MVTDRMTEDRTSAYVRGTVERYNDQEGFGFIRPNDTNADRLFFRRVSLRDISMTLRTGDRILFCPSITGRGPLATDVHPELPPGAPFDTDEGVAGTIASYFPQRQFGFIPYPGKSRILSYLFRN